MRILLTGKNGQVGFELQRALAPLGEVTAVDRTTCDLTDPGALRSAVRAIQPSIIVNPAAFTAVDRAESDVETAHAVNAAAPGILGEEAATCGALVIHYSTDYVFNGRKEGPYDEQDDPDPQSVYGRSKLAGERLLQASGARHVILRTSWVFGVNGANFARTMLRLAAQRDALDVVADQTGAPTPAGLIADVTAHIVARYRQDGRTSFPFGLFHLAAAGATHWCDYARAVVSAAHGAGQPLRLLPENIRAVTTADYPTPARRPANSVLDTRKLREAFGLRLPPWQEGLAHVLQEIFRCRA